jgi:hypothetical protein
VFKIKWKYLQGPDLLLVLGIGLVALIHTSLEKTLYYWDFGDYQRNLIQLHLAAKDGFGPFISQLWEFQNSEYPVSWAGPFALFPFFSFTNRAAFTILISTMGIYLWAKSTQILAFKIFKNLQLSKLALIVLCCSAGPWMLALRGWPDVIACGLIWFGFARSFETNRAEEFVWGLLLILLGVVMRKTTFDLGFCLALISTLSITNLQFFQNAKAALSKKRMIFVLQFTLILTWLILNPGFIESVFLRNNRDFYKPFQVTFKEYINNLVAMNGSIFLLLSLVAVAFLLTYGFREKRFGIVGLGIFPFLYTAIWMSLFKQATDHHMVQWVPTIATLGTITILHFFKDRKNWPLIKRSTILFNFLMLGIVLTMTETPFASPSNAFARPFAHSVAPLQRPDIASLMALKKEIAPLIFSGKSFVSLNESHEFNQGTLKAMFQDVKSDKLSLLSIGTVDYRDDPGFRNFFEAEYLLVPDPYIPLIPKYQRTLMEFNSEFQMTAGPSGFWQKEVTYQIGDTSASSTWWSNDYAKTRTNLSLYRRIAVIPEDYRRNFVQAVYKNTQKLGTEMAKLQLVSGSASSAGASLANNGVVTLRLTKSSPTATVYVENAKIALDSNCYITVIFESGISTSIRPGKSTLQGVGNPNQFIRLMQQSKNQENCNVVIR